MATTQQHRRTFPPRAMLPFVVVQFALAGYAWTDLARRPRSLVRGPKPAWAAVIAINFVGPIIYLRFGRLSRSGASRA